MTLEELVKEIDKLSHEQLQIIREHIEQLRRTEADLKIVALHEAIGELREGLSEDELEEMIQAMNVEYLEPFDENEWQS